MSARVAGVLLAAGQGSRFGQPKALVELDGQTLAERGVHMLQAGGADPILVVTGAAPVVLAPADQVHTVYNGEWRTGMGSSLRAALRALSEAGQPDNTVLPLPIRSFPRTWPRWWSPWLTSRWWARGRSRA